ncbi:SRPBCC domain-containing protein [Hoeflea sp.]|uniref:SRPBCC domain-containing protein n=1 Tax=Hoeflea sp. TaxID=1940281 RepID=UPI003A9509EB
MSGSIEIRNERVFPVDRETLFAAFADPAKLAKWWGPEGFDNSISAFDLKPGGQWLITMTADTGAAYHNRWSFEEVIPGQTIRMTHHVPMHVFTLDMTFTDAGQCARLSWRMIFDRTDENQEMQPFLHAANEQNFDRLERLLQKGLGSD